MCIWLNHLYEPIVWMPCNNFTAIFSFISFEFFLQATTTRKRKKNSQLSFICNQKQTENIIFFVNWIYSFTVSRFCLCSSFRCVSYLLTYCFYLLLLHFIFCFRLHANLLMVLIITLIKYSKHIEDIKCFTKCFLLFIIDIIYNF